MKLVSKMAVVAVATSALVGGCGGSSSSSSSSSSSTTGGTASSGPAATSAAHASSGGTGSSAAHTSSGGTGSSGPLTCGRPATATVNEGGTCSTSDRCKCGLDCVSGQCMRSCNTPDVQDICTANHLCVETATATYYCAQVAAVDESCLTTTVCSAQTRCDVVATHRDDAGQPVADEATCHTPCGTGSTCAGNLKCLPSTEGYYDVQSTDAGVRVTCTVGGANNCNTADGFACVELSGGTFCSHPIVACGTAIPPVDLREGGDGGFYHQLTIDDLCNTGPTNANFGGSRYCDNFASQNLTSPPEVLCMDLGRGGANALPAGAGECFAFCHDPTTRGAPGVTRDCPAGYTCQDSIFFQSVGATATSPDILCNDDTGCTAYPGAQCVALGTRPKACAIPYGYCQLPPLPGLGSSSRPPVSGGGSSSAAPASSDAPASSAAPASSDAPASSASSGGSAAS